MIRGLTRLNLVTLAALWLAPALGTSPALAQEKSAAAKALEANPALRTALDTPTFRELKDKLPKTKIGATTYYFAEGDMRLDEAGLMFYASERNDQVRRFRDAKLPGLPGTAPSPRRAALPTRSWVGSRLYPGSTLIYCVLKSTFGNESSYQSVVDNMKAATQDWSQTINLKFKHDDSQDMSARRGGPDRVRVYRSVRRARRPMGSQSPRPSFQATQRPTVTS